jgi:ATP adenylyltransferase
LNKIWAPWRIRYITQKKKKGCLFCGAYRNKKNDKNNFVVYRSSKCFVLLNIFPYNNGHLMVALNRHIFSLEKVDEEEFLDINKTIIKMIKILKKILKPQGFNVGINIGKIAGAGIEGHLHFHIVPRWLGDTNFMPVLSNTKVISQSLRELYNQLKKCLQEEK